MVHQSKQQARTNVTLKTLYHPSLRQEFIADSGRIRQILNHLLANAIQYTASGSIILKVDGKQTKDEFDLVIGIADTGIGIAPDQLKDLFETADHLSLSICKSLVNSLGGEIGVVSKLGQGSTFWVRMPLRLGAERCSYQHFQDGGVIMPDKTTHDPDRVAIIGAGPAGLMAAEALTQRGIGVDIYEAMPSAGRKLLMAGKSGLNITHTEDEQVFLARYGDDARIADLVRLFGPMQIISWMQGLGIPAHIGSTGRVFPQMMKASPLLRKWLARLQDAGAVIHPRHYWLGWDDDGGLKFDAPKGALRVMPRATVLALGGGSWRTAWV